MQGALNSTGASGELGGCLADIGCATLPHREGHDWHANITKTSQWFLLNRKHADLAVEHGDDGLLGMPDEFYLGTLLNSHQLHNETTCDWQVRRHWTAPSVVLTRCVLTCWAAVRDTCCLLKGLRKLEGL